MRITALVMLLTLGCGPAVEPPTEAPPQESAGGTRLELRTSPLVELWYAIRAQAATEGREPDAGFEQAVAAAREIQHSLGSFGGWGPLDSHVFAAADAAELAARFGELDEPYERRGRMISIRDPAVRIATAMQAIMPAFLESDWPGLEKQLERRRARLEAELMPRHQQALRHMMDSLGVPDPEMTVPVYLVHATNPPGAMTYRLYGGGAAVVIEATGEESLLRETILHESCHVLDGASRDPGTAFAVLREILEQRGLTRRERAWHDVPHTLMFVQAEQTMRRLFDPDHVGYGEATTLYARMREIAVVERDLWPRYLDGDLERDEALRQMVERLDRRPEDP